MNFCCPGRILKYIVILSLALECACIEPAFAQETAQASREEILSVYSFSPHTLTAEQQSLKSKNLDALWKKAKENRGAYVPLLKQQLQETNVPAFFLFDGSSLLLDLSNTEESRRIALQAMARCDLRDVEMTEYLRQVHRLATFGADTTAAAFHILDDPKFKAIIPQHALTLGQDFCLILMLFPTDPEHWLSRAVKRLQVETDPVAQKSLVYLLWYAQTPESDAAVLDFSEASDKPAINRDFARDLAGGHGQVLALKGRPDSTR